MDAEQEQADSPMVVDATEVRDIDTIDKGPWELLLACAAGIVGLLLQWAFGSRTSVGYLLSFATFAGLMLACLWVARRNANLEQHDES